MSPDKILYNNLFAIKYIHNYVNQKKTNSIKTVNILLSARHSPVEIGNP
jgi:hypothetical protein